MDVMLRGKKVGTWFCLACERQLAGPELSEREIEEFVLVGKILAGTAARGKKR
jgi:hypothetical protein